MKAFQPEIFVPFLNDSLITQISTDTMLLNIFSLISVLLLYIGRHAANKVSNFLKFFGFNHQSGVAHHWSTNYKIFHYLCKAFILWCF